MFEEKLAVPCPSPSEPSGQAGGLATGFLYGGGGVEPAFGQEPTSTRCACPSGCSWQRRPSSGQFSPSALGPPPAPAAVVCLPSDLAKRIMGGGFLGKRDLAPPVAEALRGTGRCGRVLVWQNMLVTGLPNPLYQPNTALDMLILSTQLNL